MNVSDLALQEEGVTTLSQTAAQSCKRQESPRQMQSCAEPMGGGLVRTGPIWLRDWMPTGSRGAFLHSAMKSAIDKVVGWSKSGELAVCPMAGGQLSQNGRADIPNGATSFVDPMRGGPRINLAVSSRLDIGNWPVVGFWGWHLQGGA